MKVRVLLQRAIFSRAIQDSALGNAHPIRIGSRTVDWSAPRAGRFTPRV